VDERAATVAPTEAAAKSIVATGVSKMPMRSASGARLSIS
jgi:hypothetical protein